VSFNLEFGGWCIFALRHGRWDILAHHEPAWPREWSFCREPGSVEFQVGRRALTVSWGRWETNKEVRWSAPFPWPWARAVVEAGK
jgi:hypothetical protein